MLSNSVKFISKSVYTDTIGVVMIVKVVRSVQLYMYIHVLTKLLEQLAYSF